MDPDAAIDAIIAALQKDDVEEASELIEGLEEWIMNGGASPSPQRLLLFFSFFRSRIQPVNVDVELDMARNIFGKLKPKFRELIQAVLQNPTDETWSNAFDIILNPGPGFGLTFWQAVLAVDPTFPKEGPQFRRGGIKTKGWPRIPSRELLLAALKYATH